MQIQITNTCNMGCAHCMEDSVCTKAHMEWDTAMSAFRFAKYYGVNRIVISGGEVTEHPDWWGIINHFAQSFENIIVLSNGEWIADAVKSRKMMELLVSFPHLCLQVSSYPTLNPRHEEMLPLFLRFQKRVKRIGLVSQFQMSKRFDLLKYRLYEIGRAAENAEIAKIAAQSETYTACFKGSLVGMGFPLREAISILEGHAYALSPKICWDGKITWSESGLCPGFANIKKDSLEDIERIAREWRPCNGCPDYEKMKIKYHNERYAAAKPERFCRLTESERRMVVEGTAFNMYSSERVNRILFSEEGETFRCKCNRI